jgi:DMSO/TMAO reductase YedYZ molybdopterin-dependent catalytic subunit
MLVWEMNGEPLPHIHGGPLRLVIPGWPGSASHKWVKRIVLRDVEHDGPGMTGTSYRVPATPMVPGSEPEGVEFLILESMPVRSIISSPANGTQLPAGTRSSNFAARPGAAIRRSRTSRSRSISGPRGRRWIFRRPATATTGGAGPRRSSCRPTGTTRSGSGRRTKRRLPAAYRGQLEPAGLRGQPDAPRRRADRLRWIDA